MDEWMAFQLYIYDMVEMFKVFVNAALQNMNLTLLGNSWHASLLKPCPSSMMDIYNY